MKRDQLKQPVNVVIILVSGAICAFSVLLLIDYVISAREFRLSGEQGFVYRSQYHYLLSNSLVALSFPLIMLANTTKVIVAFFLVQLLVFSMTYVL